MQSKKNIGRFLAVLVSVTMMFGLIPVVTAATATTLTDITIGSDTISVGSGGFPTDGAIMGYAVGSSDPNEVTHELYVAIADATNLVVKFTFSGVAAEKYKKIARGTAATNLSGATFVDTNDPSISVDGSVTTLTLADVKKAPADEEYWLYDASNNLLAAVRIMKTGKTTITATDGNGTDEVSVTYDSTIDPTGNGTFTHSANDFSSGKVVFVDYDNSGNEKMTVNVAPDVDRTYDIDIKIGGASVTDGAGYTKTGDSYEIIFSNANTYEVIITFSDLTPSPPSPPSPSTDDDASGDSGSSSAPIVTNTPTAVSLSTANDAAFAAAQAAAASGSLRATARLKNPGAISLEILQGMAFAAGMPLRVNADSMTEGGGAVDVRISLDPSKATKDLNLSASTTNAAAKGTEALFEKWFNNNVTVVSFGQQGSFGQTIEVAVKVDPALNKNSLMFYSYDRATNTYKLIPSTNYWVDSNGYVHFFTSVAGDIIITDKPLVKK